MDYLEGLQLARSKCVEQMHPLLKKLEPLQRRLEVIDELIALSSPGASDSASNGHTSGQGATRVTVARGQGKSHQLRAIIISLLKQAPNYELHIDAIKEKLKDRGIEEPEKNLPYILTRHFAPVKRGTGVWTLKNFPEVNNQPPSLEEQYFADGKQEIATESEEYLNALPPIPVGAVSTDGSIEDE